MTDGDLESRPSGGTQHGAEGVPRPGAPAPPLAPPLAGPRLSLPSRGGASWRHGVATRRGDEPLWSSHAQAAAAVDARGGRSVCAGAGPAAGPARGARGHKHTGAYENKQLF